MYQAVTMPQRSNAMRQLGDNYYKFASTAQVPNAQRIYGKLAPAASRLDDGIQKNSNDAIVKWQSNGFS